MKIYLPWKRKGFDGKWYRSILKMEYSHTQNEELNKRADKLARTNRESLFKKQQTKKKKSGLMKCPGHKFPKMPMYSPNNQCSICGGYK